MAKAADYRTDPDFQALVQLWQKDGQAPLVLIDWLLDRGLDVQAEAARWANTNRVSKFADDWTHQTLGYTTPNFERDRYYWVRQEPSWDIKWADAVPPKVYKSMPSGRKGFPVGYRFIDCIIDLLDNWYLGAELDY